MKIEINEKKYDLHYSLRIYMLYENIANKALDPTNLTLTDLTYLFYCAIVATLQYNKADIIPYYDAENPDFLDYIDDNGGEMLILKFGEWFAAQVEIQSKLQQDQPKDDNDAKKK